MMKLLEYIFYKACKFDEFISKDNHEWTYFYGVVIVTLYLSLSLYLILDILLYSFNPDGLDLMGKYFKYVITVILLLVLVHVRRKKRYVRIMEKCNKFSRKKKFLYGIFSLLYILIVIIGTLWIGELIRDFNLKGRYINLW